MVPHKLTDSPTEEPGLMMTVELRLELFYHNHTWGNKVGISYSLLLSDPVSSMCARVSEEQGWTQTQIGSR